MKRFAHQSGRIFIIRSQGQLVKIGGSFLRHRRSCHRVVRWLNEHQRNRDWPLLVLVGGGAAVDRVRQRQGDQCLDDVAVHWLAIDAMRKNGHHFARQTGLSGVSVGDRNQLCDQLSRRDPGTRILLCDRPVFAVPELVCSWETTSDVLALWLSQQMKGWDLILAKQVNPLEPVISAGKMRDLGWVDAEFARRLQTASQWLDRPRKCRPAPVGSAQIWIRHFPSRFHTARIRRTPQQPDPIRQAMISQPAPTGVSLRSVWTRVVSGSCAADRGPTGDHR